MAKKLKTLKVFANPYGHLDHEGRLAGRVQFDPTHAGGSFQFIGARFHAEHTKILEVFPDGDARGSHIQDTVYEFGSEVVTIPESTYHQDAIRNGEIFAAEDGSVPWLKLARARLAALARWEDNYGEGPDTSMWAELFPLDADVQKVAVAIGKKDADDAAKKKSDAAADAKKAADAADADAKDKKAKREESHAKALASLDKPAPAPKPQAAPAIETPAPSGGSK